MIIRLFLFFLIAFIFNFISSCKDNSVNYSVTNKSISVIDFVYKNSYPHDTTSFTEGFLIHDSKLYESTGASRDLPQTKSLFGIVDLTTGRIDAKVVLDKVKYFGEGITFLNGKVFQLTYKNKIGFVYDATTFKKIREFTLPSKEGWGLTTDRTNLIMSDGTYKLTFIDPETLQVTRTITVTENGSAKDYLNELEYINGYIYANIWKTSTIVKIDPTDGKVVGLLDLISLSLEANYLYPHSLEMNGIAYDSITDKIFVTGKLWPKIYELEFSH